MSTEYSTHVLPPTHPEIANYANAYSRLRLQGLKQDPNSFSSTYEDELNIPSEQQISRLQLKKRHVIIAAVDGADQALHACEWVGSVTLLGPLSWEEYAAPFPDRESHVLLAAHSNANANALADRTEASTPRASFWHMTALYVDQGHRRKGLAKKLCDAAFRLIEQTGAEDSHELRIIIKPENVGVVKMYEDLGFVAGSLKATLAEAVVASGEAAVGEETLAREAKYSLREGVVMVKRI